MPQAKKSVFQYGFAIKRKDLPTLEEAMKLMMSDDPLAELGERLEPKFEMVDDINDYDHTDIRVANITVDWLKMFAEQQQNAFNN